MNQQSGLKPEQKVLQMKSILLMEQKPHIRESLTILLDPNDQFYKVMTAKNFIEATDVIDTLQIDVLILGMTLEPAEVNNLSAHLKKNDQIQLIIIDDGDGRRADIYQDLNHDAVLKKPIQPDLMLDIINNHNGIEYGGHIRGINLGSFLQMIQLESKTGVIHVRSGDQSGRLYIENGSLISASTDGLNGKEAALKILSWETPTISLNYHALSIETTIRDSLMGILLESCQVGDEENGCTDLRKHERFGCSQEILFSVDNLVYRGIIRNVSMGGIFIESSTPISSGKDTRLTIQDPESMEPEFIFGRIVHSTDSGIGVEFARLEVNQKKMLRALVQDANLTEGF
jgi:CheY-like chemotaxis protein